MFVQQLNNSAAMCIEIGQYDRAIASLAKALRLSELHVDNQTKDACLCHDCSLDGCISYSENTPYASVPIATNNTANTTSIYRRPIRVTSRSILEGHIVGSTLFLIIIFNLAMAHHLRAVTTTSSEEACQAKLKNTLKLYELANSWQHRDNCEECDSEDDDELMYVSDSDNCSEQEHQQQQQQSYHSIRFNMIIYNNLSHIHQSLSDNVKHREYLQRLLSTIMQVVDQQNHHNLAIMMDVYCDGDEDFLARPINLEGFVKNAFPLILQKSCADAA